VISRVSLARVLDCKLAFERYRTLFSWKENYLKELAKRKNDKLPEVKELPPKKRGRPLLVGNELDVQVQL